MSRIRSFLVLASIVLVGTQAWSAEPQGAIDPNMVYVRAVVKDSSGRFTTGLAQTSFKISEDNKPQEIVYFSGGEAPTKVAILLDGSRSWKDQAGAIASSVFRSRSNPADEFFVVDPADIAPNEAVLQTLNRLFQSGDNSLRALVFLTDRLDPSGYSFSRVKDLLQERDVQLYVISLTSDPSVERGRAVLRDLADTSGGKSYFPLLTSLVESLCQNVVRELRYQYLIGYRPTNDVKDGKWRKVEVTAELPIPNNLVKKLDVRTKPGYNAPKVAAAPARR